ncbi:MAG: exopolysaccharide Pel transporter PelG, partial [Melioribacteraceae bacterium]|nr:exopolysaccharide Pel transporter PelG [Melioribacteraceae bacterium]
MAGIGFELRKLFNEQGLISNVKAYGYSSMTTIGPMLLSIFLIFALQKMMTYYDGSFIEWELYIATVTYCFIFSIILTSGLAMVLSRFIADMLYIKRYEHLLSSYYGALIIIIPISGVIAIVFLSGVTGSLGYKIATYLFFLELTVIWIQSIYLSVLKDYVRIVRSFIIGVGVSLLSGWLLFLLANLQPTTSAILAIVIGFFTIVTMTSYHFEITLPKANSKYYFTFIQNLKKYPSLFFTGLFVYSGVYIHSMVYWYGPFGVKVGDHFRVMPFYDLPVFFAYLSVIPSLVIFVVVVETKFYEKFRLYYLNVLEGGTFQRIKQAKKEMQKSLLLGASFLIEVQLLFSVLSIALGIKVLPTFGFTMVQLDLFIILCLGFFLFIIMFILVHLLLYFDDRKGALLISSFYIIINGISTYWMMILEFNGFGMFI